nr:glycerol-3-phosphate acyltransferase [Actinomycetota bacterium]
MHLRLPRLLFAAASGYLLGTVPSADIASRVAKGGVVDLRSSGSRNPGGVNALRLLGNTPGRAVIVADVGKGYAACACGRLAGGDLGAHVAGVAAVVGHCYPVWTRFQGGKGVATSFGQCLYTFPAFAPVQLAVAVAATRVPRVQQRALVSA